MLWNKKTIYSFFLALFVGLVFWTKCSEGGESEEHTTVYLVRHAEKSLKDTKDEDPPLIAVGEQRADALKDLLKDKSIAAVYTTSYRRNINTVAPLAGKKNLELSIYKAHQYDFLVQEVTTKHVGKKLVICGHSNTLIPIAKALGVSTDLPDDLAALDYDKMIKVKISKKGKASMETVQFGPPNPVNAYLMVLNKSANSLSVKDLYHDELIKELPTGTGPHEISISPDKKYAIASHYGSETPGNSLLRIDLENWSTQVIELGEYTRPHGLSFRKDREVVVTSESTGKLLVVDIENSRIKAIMDIDQPMSHMVAVDRKGDRAFVSSIQGNSVSVFDLKNRKLLKVLETGAGSEGIAFHPIKQEVWVTNREDNSINVIDANKLEVIERLDAGDFAIRVTFTHAGDKAVVSNARSGEVWIFDVDTRKVLQKIALGVEKADDTSGRLLIESFGDSPVPLGTVIDPDDHFAFVSTANADKIVVIDLLKLEVVKALDAGKEPDGIALLAK